MAKFNFTKLEKELNYYNVTEEYLVEGENGELENFNFDTLFDRGIDEDDFPTTFEGFKKLHIPLKEKVIWASDFDNNVVTYFFNKEFNEINIRADNFTIKEFITIFKLVRKHLEINKGKELFVSFGNDSEETHTLYHGESTAFDCWVKDFYDLFMSRINGENKLESVTLCIHDYETEDKDFYTKDRVIHIVLE